MTRERCVVVGGSGFIGSAVVDAISPQWDVEVVRSPRLSHRWSDDPARLALSQVKEIESLALRMGAAAVVVNAAGVSRSSEDEDERLFGANALLPRVVREAAVAIGARRFVHVSSAGVQGRRSVLNESESVAPISPYTESKALGEVALRGCAETIIYRPTSVHGTDRRVTRQLARLARSAFAVVAGDGSAPSPQVLVENVGAACAHLIRDDDPPPIVLHPWEGVTTGSLMSLLGGKDPRHIPERLARAVLHGGRLVASPRAGLVSQLRRLEMLMLGQRQEPGWLDLSGWVAPHAQGAWERLAISIQNAREV